MQVLIKGRSPLSDWKSRDCKIKSLSLPSISLLHKTTCFYFIKAAEKKVQLSTSLNFFFQLLANDDFKVNKTQRIVYCLDFDAINFRKWKIKRNFKGMRLCEIFLSVHFMKYSFRGISSTMKYFHEILLF